MKYSYSEIRIPEDMASEVLTVASQYYAKQNQGYKLPELIEAGAEVQISPYEIAGTENRIAVERMRYNQAINAYNQQLQQFPNVLFAKVFGFKPMPFYKSSDRSIKRRL